MTSEKVYRIQVKIKGFWKIGIKDYTKEEAEEAQKRMLDRGVQCRVVPFYESQD